MAVKSPAGADASEGDARYPSPRTLLAIVLVECVTILALYAFGRHFS